jgi:hypothetical protein
LRGPTFLAFLPGLTVPPGPAFVLDHGKIVFNITPTGVRILVSQTGAQVDLCAMLA